MSDSPCLQTSNRSKLRRIPQRGSQERKLIYEILDEALVAQVGFVVDGQPLVIPMAYARDNDRLYVHGSPVSRLMKTLAQGVEVCFTVTILDALVIARSLYHHSMNYRSVVLFGRATLVADEVEKMSALKAFTEHMIRGRWQDARQPNPLELKGTTVLSLPIVEGSAKIRTGPPLDDPQDHNLPIWAGELPLKLTPGKAISASKLAPDLTVPDNIAYYRR